MSREGRRAASSSPPLPSCLQTSDWSAASGNVPLEADCSAPKMRLQVQRECRQKQVGDVKRKIRREERGYKEKEEIKREWRYQKKLKTSGKIKSRHEP